MKEKYTRWIVIAVTIFCLWFLRAELYQWVYRQIHADCLPRQAARYGALPDDGRNPMARTATRPTPNKPSAKATPKTTATPKTREITITFPDDGGTEHTR